MAKKSKPKTRHLVWLSMLAVGGVLAMVLGWWWQATLMCQRIDLAGHQHATSEALLALARVDTDTLLFDIDPDLVEDRLRRHPWVAEASVRRLPTGTLALRVTERVPTMLVMNRRGAPSHYLDAQGAQMPLVPKVAYDVPLLWGLNAPYHPIQPVAEPSVLAFLQALDRADPAVEALISEVVFEGELVVHTTPAHGHGAIPVHLGRADFEGKFKRLHAFWHQAVLPRPDKTFRRIDLRANSQIVTRESVNE